MKNNTTLQKGKKPNNDIKLYSLGGLGVVGMNMYIVECNDEIIIMDVVEFEGTSVKIEK